MPKSKMKTSRKIVAPRRNRGKAAVIEVWATVALASNMPKTLSGLPSLFR